MMRPATITVDFESLSPERAQEMVDKIVKGYKFPSIQADIIEGISIGVHSAFAEIQRVGRLG